MATSNLFNSDAVFRSVTTQTAQTKKISEFNLNSLSDWNTPPFGWELIAISVIGLSLVLYAISLGRDKITNLLLSMYVAYSIFLVIPDMQFLSKLSLGQYLNSNVLLFLLFYGVIIVIFIKSAVVSGIVSASFVLWQQAVLVLCTVLLFASLLFEFIPKQGFGNGFETLLLSPVMRFGIFILPILLLFLFSRGDKHFKYS